MKYSKVPIILIILVSNEYFSSLNTNIEIPSSAENISDDNLPVTLAVVNEIFIVIAKHPTT